MRVMRLRKHLAFYLLPSLFTVFHTLSHSGFIPAYNALGQVSQTHLPPPPPSAQVWDHSHGAAVGGTAYHMQQLITTVI